MCKIHIGDIVTVEQWGAHYPSYIDAFHYFNLKSNSPIEENRKKKKHYVVIGLVVHENKRHIIAHIASRDNHHFIIQTDGLKKIGEVDCNNLSQIRDKYAINILNHHSLIKLKKI
jgi:hypothetical protein